MKYCPFSRHLLGVLCAVLVSVKFGQPRPQSGETLLQPLVNCSNVSSSGTNEKQASDESKKGSNINPDFGIEKVVKPQNSQSSETFQTTTEPFRQNPTTFDLTSEETEYIDYYYEEPEEAFPHQDQLSDGPQVPNHQPPPGLNRVAKLKLIKTPRRQPPEYMLELYDRFSRAAAATPVTTQNPADRAGDDDSDLGADIVRSFPNINKEDTADVEVEQNDVRSNDDADDQLPGRETRHHTLVFNVTSLLNGEEVSRAELRLYTLVKQDRNTYVGEDREVRVYEGLGTQHLPPVACRRVYGHASGWEAFDVTHVVQSWVRQGSRTGDGVHVLEVKIDSVFHGGRNGTTFAALDIDVDPEHNEGPLLVVFSRDATMHVKQELHNLIDHKASSYDTSEQSDDSPDTSAGNSKEAQADIFNNAEENDIDVSPSSSKTKHVAGSKRQRRELFFPDAKSSNPEVVPRRVRRDKRKRNSCRRKPLYVDFQDINWHQWIIAPQGYQAFECVGKCYLPIGDHLSPTNHAIIQTLVHAVQPKSAARACCVPTKLEPISILYLDKNGVITYKYHYDGMVVAGCGCR